MKLLSVIRKSLKEQIRSYWLLILTVSTAPFFVMVYYLITQSYEVKYNVLILNKDLGVQVDTVILDHGKLLINEITKNNKESSLIIKEVETRAKAEEKLKNRKADILMVIPENFSEQLAKTAKTQKIHQYDIEFAGDLTNQKYIIGAIWTHSLLSGYITNVTNIQEPFNFIETFIGTSGDRSDFEIAVPGLLVLSIIMLMLSASSAIVVEAEKKTLTRLKISKVSAPEFLGGVSIVQILLGIAGVILTLVVALGFGFRYEGSFLLVLLITILTSISIIAFSVIIAAFTRSVTQVLVVGNFPFFLFMFFSGVMFPLNTHEWFSIGDYGVSVISLLSASPAVSALNKILIMQEGFTGIIPEIIVLVLLSIIYFSIGAWFFRRRHMKSE
jgi:ABC-2 type transport system permease protein